MGLFGNLLGQAGGALVGGYFGGDKGRSVGQNIGGQLGNIFLPYKKGGMVKPAKGKKTQKAVLHKGELVVPASMVKDVPKTLKKKIAKKGGRNML